MLLSKASRFLGVYRRRSLILFEERDSWTPPTPSDFSKLYRSWKPAKRPGEEDEESSLLCGASSTFLTSIADSYLGCTCSRTLGSGVNHVRRALRTSIDRYDRIRHNDQAILFRTAAPFRPYVMFLGCTKGIGLEHQAQNEAPLERTIAFRVIWWLEMRPGCCCLSTSGIPKPSVLDGAVNATGPLCSTALDYVGSAGRKSRKSLVAFWLVLGRNLLIGCRAQGTKANLTLRLMSEHSPGFHPWIVVHRSNLCCNSYNIGNFGYRRRVLGIHRKLRESSFAQCLSVVALVGERDNARGQWTWEGDPCFSVPQYEVALRHVSMKHELSGALARCRPVDLLCTQYLCASVDQTCRNLQHMEAGENGRPS